MQVHQRFVAARHRVWSSHQLDRPGGDLEAQTQAPQGYVPQRLVVKPGAARQAPIRGLVAQRADGGGELRRRVRDGPVVLAVSPRAGDAGPGDRTNEQPFVRNVRAADVADPEGADREALLRGAELRQRTLGPLQQCRLAGLIQRRGRSLGIVLVVGEGQAPGNPHVFDGRRQGIPLGLGHRHALTQQLSEGQVVCRHQVIVGCRGPRRGKWAADSSRMPPRPCQRRW